MARDRNQVRSLVRGGAEGEVSAIRPSDPGRRKPHAPDCRFLIFTQLVTRGFSLSSSVPTRPQLAPPRRCLAVKAQTGVACAFEPPPVTGGSLGRVGTLNAQRVGAINPSVAGRRSSHALPRSPRWHLSRGQDHDVGSEGVPSYYISPSSGRFNKNLNEKELEVVRIKSHPGTKLKPTQLLRRSHGGWRFWPWNRITAAISAGSWPSSFP
jgi:hypothetical protein